MVVKADVLRGMVDVQKCTKFLRCKNFSSGSLSYEDMDQYMSTRIGGRCQKDYELEIKADMNTCIVTFSFPDGTEHHATIPRKYQTRFFVPTPTIIFFDFEIC